MFHGFFRVQQPDAMCSPRVIQRTVGDETFFFGFPMNLQDSIHKCETLRNYNNWLHDTTGTCFTKCSSPARPTLAAAVLTNTAVETVPICLVTSVD